MAKAQMRLSEAQKSAVCDYCKKNPRLNYEQVGIWVKKEFKLPTAPDRTTIAKIVKDSTRYESVQPQNRRLLKAQVIF